MPLSAADVSPFGKRLRSRRPDPQPSSVKETGGEKAEFQGFRLRRTTSQEQREKTSRGGGSGYDFGVKLRVREEEGEGGKREGGRGKERGRGSWRGSNMKLVFQFCVHCVCVWWGRVPGYVWRGKLS